MKEVTGNLWTYPAECRAITTNGSINRNRECVMGRGCALQARNRFPGLAKQLADYIIRMGNVPHLLKTTSDTGYALVSFPVKEEWSDVASTKLITQSATRLVAMADLYGWKTVVLPRPGCGNGKLKWGNVKPLLEPLLDDRFHVISYEREQ